MKESILDVLLYLFEHYFTEDADLVRDRDSLQSGLLQAGFSPAETSKAFDWLDALAAQRPSAAIRRVDGPTRVYFGPELDKLDVECRGFLMVLEQHGILDRSEEHTSELQSLMRISYAVFCLKKKKQHQNINCTSQH